MPDLPPKHLPTPEEIAAACAKFRETWTEREYRRRLVGFEEPVLTVPECSTAQDARRGVAVGTDQGS